MDDLNSAMADVSFTPAEDGSLPDVITLCRPGVIRRTACHEYELEVLSAKDAGPSLDQMKEVLRDAYRLVMPERLQVYDDSVAEAESAYRLRVRGLAPSARAKGPFLFECMEQGVTLETLKCHTKRFSEAAAALLEALSTGTDMEPDCQWKPPCQQSRLIRCSTVALFAKAKHGDIGLKGPFEAALGILGQFVREFESATQRHRDSLRYFRNIQTRCDYLGLLHDIIYGDADLNKLMSLYLVDVLHLETNRMETLSARIGQADEAAKGLLDKCRRVSADFKALLGSQEGGLFS